MLERKGFDPSSQALLELMNKHGLKTIPPNELEKLGFVYDENKNIVRIEVLVKRAQAKSKLELKREAEPFSQIEIELNTGTYELRHEVELGQKIDKKYEGGNINILKIIPPDNPLKIFLKSHKFSSSPDWLNIEIKRILEDKNGGVIENLEIKSGLEKKLIYLNSRKENGDEAPSQEFYESIQRARARYTDLSVVKAAFENYYQASTLEHWKTDRDTFHYSDEELAYFKEHHIYNLENLTVHRIGQLLITRGFQRLGQDISELRTFDEVVVRLNLLSGEDFPHMAKKREIEAHMKTVTETEQKKALGGEKKKVVAQSKDENKLIEGIRLYCRQYEVVARIMKEYIDEIEQASFRVKKGEFKKRSYIFDASMNEELDADPGKISGDCTEGKPLPFKDPNIPVFNVKVFENKSKHIGNIYLLITKSREGKTVWHLDAIQIPALLDWPVAIKQLFTGLGEQARKKGVTFITVNHVPSLISNYDYIVDACISIFEEVKKTEEIQLKLEIPAVTDDTYSDFQYSGYASVVWRNE